MWSEQLADETFASTVPPYDQLIGDAVGDLWVRRYVLDANAPVTWDIFGPDGNWRTTVAIPANLSILEVGHDYLLAVHTDLWDVQSVPIHFLGRAPAN